MKKKKEERAIKIITFLGFAIAFSIVFAGLFARAHYWYQAGVSGLVEKKPAVNEFDSATGLTPLMRAVNSNDSGVAMQLLQSGADPNLSSKAADLEIDKPSLFTALHYAVLRGDSPQAIQIMQRLLENRANPHVRDFLGNTPLHWVFAVAAPSYQQEMSELLLRYGADLNAQNNDGNTFIHTALASANRSVIHMVRDRFNSIVNLEIKNNGGFNAQEYAQFLGQYDTANQNLVRAFAGPGVIVGQDGNANARDAMGYTALMLAIMAGSIERAERLIVAGASLSAVAQDTFGSSVLHIAIMQQKPDMLDLLLKKSEAQGLLFKNNKGNTPLHAAFVISSNSIRKKIIELLLNAGKNRSIVKEMLNAQNNDGQTVLHEAVATGDESLVRWIFENFREDIDFSLLNRNRKTARETAERLGFSFIAQLIAQTR